VIDLSDFEGQLRYQRGQLLVCPPEKEATPVPLADVGVVLLGLKTSVGGAVLHQLAEFDVIVLVCDWRGVPIGGLYGWHAHSRVGARHLAQAEVSLPRQKNAWAQIVRAKIMGQAENLRCRNHPDFRSLANMAKAVRSGDPDNLEAQAARFYWKRIFGDAKFSRDPGGGLGRNAQLDYGYMILRAHAVRAVLSAGLSPSLGLFHRGRSNFFNLADDLIEPFRPAVDWTVSGLTAEMTPNHPGVKAQLVAASAQAFTVSGLSVAACLTDLAQQLGQYFENSVPKLLVDNWSPSSLSVDS
jgi:CRISPR-associated protein Cas1